jgi:pyruvate carboxylase
LKRAAGIDSEIVRGRLSLFSVLFLFFTLTFAEADTDSYTCIFLGAEKSTKRFWLKSEGKTRMILLLYSDDADENGMRTVYFRLNGQTRTVDIKDKKISKKKEMHQKAFGEHQIDAPFAIEGNAF